VGRVRVLTSAEEGVARDRDAERKLKIHQILVDVLLDSVDVMATVVRTGLGQTQFNAQRETLGRMETQMDAVMNEVDEAYSEVERYLEEGTELVTRMSRVFDRVSKTKQVVDAAAAKRRFVRGVDRHEVVGRAALKEKVARERQYMRKIDEGETDVIDLVESGTDEESDEEMEAEEVVEESESDEGEDIDSQESDDELPE